MFINNPTPLGLLVMPGTAFGRDQISSFRDRGFFLTGRRQGIVVCHMAHLNLFNKRDCHWPFTGTAVSTLFNSEFAWWWDCSGLCSWHQMATIFLMIASCLFLTHLFFLQALGTVWVECNV